MQKKDACIHIQKMVRGWQCRFKAKKDLKMILKTKRLEYLMYSEYDYRRFKGVQTIEKYIYAYMRKKKREALLYSCAEFIQKLFRAKRMKHVSFVNALDLQNDSRIFFLKEQKIDFFKILAQFCEGNKQYNI